MRFEVLGPVRLGRGGGVGGVVAGRLRQTLLGMLLVRGGRAVPVDVLLDALWPAGGDPQRLQVHASRLRRDLDDPGRLVFEAGAYRLRVEPGELDAERFDRAVTEAERLVSTDPGRCAALLRDALDLWRGRPYGGLDSPPELADEARRLLDRRLAATELLYAAELDLGRHAEVAAELAELVRRHPLRERLAALLMSALHRSGRQADALRVYRDTRAALVDELGLEPGPELRALERRILTAEDEPADPGAPAQLPHGAGRLVGRDQELAALDKVAGADLVCVLAGTAGVGKSALAVHWARAARDRYPDGQLFADLNGYGPGEPAAPADVLAGFLRALGVAGAAIPADLAERAARFRTVASGRRLLVLLDNARTAEQVRPLLPGGDSAFVLVTSRDALAGLAVREGAVRVDLDRLSTAAALDLLRDSIGAAAAARAPAATERLVDLCARLPLALRIAGESIGARREQGVAELVADLADESERLDQLDAHGDRHSAVRAVFSWSYQELGPRPALLFRMLGRHPGREVGPGSLAALAGTSPKETRRLLDGLVRANLVERTGPARYRPHDLLRVYAAELAAATETEADHAAARRRLESHYLHTALAAMNLVVAHPVHAPELAGPPVAVPELADYAAAMAWLDSELPGLLAVAAGSTSRYPADLSRILTRYLEMRGDHLEALRLYERALVVSRGDLAAEAGLHRGLGVAHSRLGNLAEAVHHFERALALNRELGDVPAEAAGLNNLGVLHSFFGDFASAVRHTRAAVARYREAGLADVVTGPLSNLGHGLVRLGRFAEAEEVLAAATAVPGNPWDHALAAYNLADLCRCRGRLDEALAHGERALALAREAGVRTVVGEAFDILGAVHLARGEVDRALRYHQDALEIADQAADQGLRVEALTGLGAALLAAGRPAEASRRYEEAAELNATSGNRYARARALAGAGDALARLGQPAAARDRWTEALALFRACGTTEADDLAGRLAAVSSAAAGHP